LGQINQQPCGTKYAANTLVVCLMEETLLQNVPQFLFLPNSPL